MREKLRRTTLVAFGRPPGLTWALAKWPIYFAALAGAAWSLLVWFGDYTRAEALSAAEVFVALGGIGGAIVAIAGVGQALTIPKPDLAIIAWPRLQRGQDSEARWNIQIANHGRGDALRVDLYVDGAVTFEWSTLDWWSELNSQSWVSRDNRIEAGVTITLGELIGDDAVVGAYPRNADAVEWHASPRG